MVSRTRIRRRAESLMTDSCSVSRVVRGVDAEGLDVVSQVEVYSGPCKVQSQSVQEMDLVSAGSPMVVQRYQVHVPVGDGPFEVGDLVQVVGRARVFRVVSLIEKTFLTAQRLGVEEVTGL